MVRFLSASQHKYLRMMNPAAAWAVNMLQAVGETMPRDLVGG